MARVTLDREGLMRPTKGTGSKQGIKDTFGNSGEAYRLKATGSRVSRGARFQKKREVN